MEILSLSNEAFAVELAPGLGGALTAARWRSSAGWADLLRPATPQALAAGDFRKMSCFAMIPFASLVDQAQFTFAGNRHELRPNFPGRNVALHGDAWQQAWCVEDARETAVRMLYVQSGDRFPFAYRAEQTITLTRGAVELSVRITNIDRQAMPAGCGFHPYFPRRGGAKLSFAATDIWERDDGGLPVRKAPIPPRLDFSDGRDAPETAVNDFFAGWDGAAHICWPADGIALRLSASSVFGHLLLFTPPDEAFFCAEPVSNIADAFNLMAAGRSDTGAVVLAPGETLSGCIRIEPVDEPTPARSTAEQEPSCQLR